MKSFKSISKQTSVGTVYFMTGYIRCETLSESRMIWWFLYQTGFQRFKPNRHYYYENGENNGLYVNFSWDKVEPHRMPNVPFDRVASMDYEYQRFNDFYRTNSHLKHLFECPGDYEFNDDIEYKIRIKQKERESRIKNAEKRHGETIVSDRKVFQAVSYSGCRECYFFDDSLRRCNKPDREVFGECKTNKRSTDYDVSFKLIEVLKTPEEIERERQIEEAKKLVIKIGSIVSPKNNPTLEGYVVKLTDERVYFKNPIGRNMLSYKKENVILIKQ